MNIYTMVKLMAILLALLQSVNLLFSVQPLLHSADVLMLCFTAFWSCEAMEGIFGGVEENDR